MKEWKKTDIFQHISFVVRIWIIFILKNWNLIQINIIFQQYTNVSKIINHIFLKCFLSLNFENLQKNNFNDKSKFT